MAEDFWGSIFASLHENLEFLRLPLADASDSDLISWIKPNRQLAAACARFFHKNSITNRLALEKVILQYAKNNPPLRKMIFFTWVEKNPHSMSIPSQPLTQEMQERIMAGEFGGPQKIEIMAAIDPREGAQQFYQTYLEHFSQKKVEESDSLPETGEVSIVKTESDDNKMNQLESALNDVKADNRKLRRELQDKNEQIVKNLARLDSQANELKELQKAKSALEAKNQSLESRLKFLEASHRDLSASKSETLPVSNDQETIDLLENEREKLKTALENRSKSIVRLEEEIAQFKSILNGKSAAEQTIKNLQSRLAEAEEGRVARKSLAGQLIARISKGEAKRKWLFIAVTGEALYVPNFLVSQASLTEEEWCLVEENDDGSVFSISSLEGHLRKEIYGVIEKKNDEYVLKTDDQSLAIRHLIDDSYLHQVVCGVWLEEINDRAAGIYALKKLDSKDSEAHEILSADMRKIKNFFSAEYGNFHKFCDFLRQHHVEFEVGKHSTIHFERDFRAVLNAVRMRLSIENCCGSNECIPLAADKPLVRKCLPGSRCDFCKKTIAVDKAEIEPLRESKRVLIFGGDRVGSEFESRLSEYNIDASWYSGFRNLNELAEGLGKSDLVVVITRQISHTMLRELLTACERSQTNVLYCSRRGITGVIEEIKKYFE